MPRPKDPAPYSFELSFTDLTLLEADGSFDVVNKIMNSQELGEHEWAIKANASLHTEFGICQFEADFLWDRSFNLIEFYPSDGNPFQNPDLRCLNYWSDVNGWKKPSPHPNLVKDNRDFWTEVWKSNQVDSDYLESKYRHRGRVNLFEESDEELNDEEYELED